MAGTRREGKKRIDEQKKRIGIEFVGFVVSTFSSLAGELLCETWLVGGKSRG